MSDLTSGGQDGDSPDHTMMMKAPAFDERERMWRPYSFGQLEKVTVTQRLLIERLSWLLPGVTAQGTVEAELMTRLRGLFADADMELKIDYVHVVAPQTLARYVAAPTFLSVIAPLPNKPRGLLEVELGLSHRAIDLLLGGAGEMSTLRALTEIEEAVMSFVVLETLKALAPYVDPGLPLLRLEGIAKKVDEALALMADEPHVVVVQLKVVLGGQAGFVRLFLPESVLRMANAPAIGAERAQRRLHQVQPHLGRLKGFTALMRVEIGRTEVSSEDLSKLEPKNVVLIDQLTAFPHRGSGGTARLKVGLGRAGTLDAEVVLDQGHFFAKVTAVSLGQTPQALKVPTAGEQQAAEMLAEQSLPHAAAAQAAGREKRVEQTNEGVELLADIPLQIVVELARVPVTAEEVVSLRVGQVFDLQRVPGEPVELSVNGKIVARGELVEVEGHLGVRILSLMG